MGKAFLPFKGTWITSIQTRTFTLLLPASFSALCASSDLRILYLSLLVLPLNMAPHEQALALTLERWTSASDSAGGNDRGSLSH